MTRIPALCSTGVPGNWTREIESEEMFRRVRKRMDETATTFALSNVIGKNCGEGLHGMLNPRLAKAFGNATFSPMIVETIPEIQKLSESEKMILIGEIWEGIGVEDTQVEISGEIEAELDRRWEHFLANPGMAKSWEEVKERILSSRMK